MARNSRALIRKAARTEFANHGFAGARVARIARSADVNKQLVFYYFKSKEGLFRAIIEECTRDLLAVLSDADATKSDEGFRTSIQNLFRSVLEREELASILMRTLSHESGMARALWKGVRDLISEGQAVGYFRDDTDPDLAARQVVALIVGYQATAPAFRDDERREEWIATSAEQVRSWLAW